tara:strand:- start:144 stop:554 length:411 start_codon:yes stop_codon:yes gene_type:complete
MADLDNFLIEAIETDTPIEYVAPLNDDGAFINGHYYEDFIKEAQVNVTILEHLYQTSDELNLKACDDWLIELKFDDETFSKEVKTNETASFIFLQEDIIGEDGIDDIEALGVNMVELSIIAIDDGHALSEIKIEVS